MSPEIQESLDILDALSVKINEITSSCIDAFRKYANHDNNIRILVVTSLGQVIINIHSFQDEFKILLSYSDKNSKEKLNRLYQENLEFLSAYEIEHARNWLLAHNLRMGRNRAKSILTDDEYENVKIPDSLDQYRIISDSIGNLVNCINNLFLL